MTKTALFISSFNDAHVIDHLFGPIYSAETEKYQLMCNARDTLQKTRKMAPWRKCGQINDQ